MSLGYFSYPMPVNEPVLQYAPGSPEKAVLNDIIKAKIKTASPVAFDSYEKLRQNGGAILIDETSFVTVGACMIQ